jgi:hypothetical protein
MMSDDKPVTAFACTEADICVPPGPLPSDPRAKHQPDAGESAALNAIFHAVRDLREHGWMDAAYAPKDGSVFLAIEPGSTGIHECTRDSIGFWIYDGDTWPARPILWKPLAASPTR